MNFCSDFILIIHFRYCRKRRCNVLSGMINSRLIIFVNVCLIALFSGCAKIGAPDGGPKDEMPPEIIETVPPQGSIRVDPEEPVIIRFNERIKRESLADAFTLSPAPPGKVTTKWKSREVSLSFDPPLQKDKTYVLTLGTQLADDRNVKLENSIHLAFSTGDQLDRGMIEGTLFSRQGAVQGWYVTGYRIGDLDDTKIGYTKADSDTSPKQPDPAYDSPDAATQAAADGSWDLRNLGPGLWRIFAFNDNDKDRLWTPAIDILAVPWRDVKVKQPEEQEDLKDISSILGDTSAKSQPDENGDSVVNDSAKAELTPSDYITLVGISRPMLPEPTRAASKIRDQVEIRFDRTITEIDADFKIEPDAEIAYTGYDPSDSSKIRIRLNQNIVDDSVLVHIIGSFGTNDTLDTTLTVSLINSVEIDTFPPRFVTSIPGEGSMLFENASSIRLIFSEEMTAPEYDALSLTDGNEDTLRYNFKIIDEVSWEISPIPKPESKLININLVGEKISDLAGNSVQDSLLSISFQLLPNDSLGIASGKVKADFECSNIHLIMRALNGIYPPLEYFLDVPGKFIYNSVPAGQWQLEAWCDMDNDEVFSPGNANPFIPADPFFQSVDTIFVRARWESGENELILR
ncbi:MAG: Ig-like domain-containing protein [Candidatus Electryonea clarkiae]|nr:Ig-like domain-containing protein [Candidatus Electryonea clarkiae]MDP8286982.1 Ig-like domain-containing protein [Candidatus Electryonea clarkiae]